MGTGKLGRNLNTKGGSARRVSDFAMVHSIEGLFIRKKGQLCLKSGGHGEKGRLLLEKYGIKYNIVKTYPNGVRVGNIPNHVKRWKRIGTNQSWFPANWTPNDIRHATEHVAGLRKNRHTPDGKISFGMYKGVRVGIIRRNGKIATVFPDSTQPTPNRRHKK